MAYMLILEALEGWEGGLFEELQELDIADDYFAHESDHIDLGADQ